jgi:hypothetical protein
VIKAVVDIACAEVAKQTFGIKVATRAEVLWVVQTGA